MNNNLNNGKQDAQ